MRNEASLAWAKGLPRRKGQAELIKHLAGERLTAQQTINAICFRCSSGYDTGLGCTVSDCPGVRRNPYNASKKRCASEPDNEVAE